MEYLKRSDTADGSSSFERNLQGLEAEYFRLRKAIRHYADATRSIKSAQNDAYNAVHAEKALTANRIIGLRRNELARLQCSDIHFISEERAEVYTIGKGGKHNVNIVSGREKVSALKMMVQEAESRYNRYLLDKTDLNNDADLHHERAECARMCIFGSQGYGRKPAKREYYKSQNSADFQAKRKNPARKLRHTLSLQGTKPQKIGKAGQAHRV